tara:strand:- start:204 stop:1091 length:888 start_codon:yes stop_codon:yes gene_type:complete
MKRKRYYRQARGAFTLIEIMVATVVMLILVGLVVQITSNVLNVWNRASGKLAANAEARIAMDLLTQDLQTAVFRNNGQQWLRVKGPIDPNGNYNNQTVSLKLFSPALDRPMLDSDGYEIPGDICAIGYRLAYKESYSSDTHSVPKTFALYRSIVDPRTTFDLLLGDPNQQELAGGLWADDSIIDEANYLVSNIVEFKIFVYSDDGSKLALNDREDDQADSKIDRDSDVIFGGTGGNATDLLYAEIVLTVVSDNGLELLRLLDEGRSGTGYLSPYDVVREHGKQFNRRVYFPSQSF